MNVSRTRQRDTWFDFLLEKCVHLFARGGTPLSAPEKDTGTHTSAQPESIPARTISKTEVTHGAVAGRETRTWREEKRTQDRLQKQTIPTTGPAVPEDRSRSVSLSHLNPELLRRIS